MVDSLPDPSLANQALPNPATPQPGVGKARPAGPGGTGAGGVGETEGARFQSLHEQIETRAKDLAAATYAVQAPDQLAGAVDSARESLETVLDLKDRLLEAYRQQQRQGVPEPAPQPTPGPEAGAS